MRIFSAISENFRGLIAIVALATMLSGSLSPGTGQAESRTSTVINGKAITVVGGSIQSINSDDRRTVVFLDGRRIVISDGMIEVDKRVHDIGRFTRIEIHARDGDLKIYVDDRLLE